MVWTFVRPNGFMSNALVRAGGHDDSQGAVYGTGGDSGLSVIRPARHRCGRDRGADRARPRGQSLRGDRPQALANLTNAEQAAILAETICQPLRYVDLPADAARQAMLGRGCPPKSSTGCWNSGPTGPSAVSRFPTPYRR